MKQIHIFLLCSVGRASRYNLPK